MDDELNDIINNIKNEYIYFCEYYNKINKQITKLYKSSKKKFDIPFQNEKLSKLLLLYLSHPYIIFSKYKYYFIKKNKINDKITYPHIINDKNENGKNFDAIYSNVNTYIRNKIKYLYELFNIDDKNTNINDNNFKLLRETYANLLSQNKLDIRNKHQHEVITIKYKIYTESPFDIYVLFKNNNKDEYNLSNIINDIKQYVKYTYDKYFEIYCEDFHISQIENLYSNNKWQCYYYGDDGKLYKTHFETKCRFEYNEKYCNESNSLIINPKHYNLDIKISSLQNPKIKYNNKYVIKNF